MSKATEDELAKLHSRVAQTITNVLEQSGTAILLLAEFPDLPDKVKRFMLEISEVNPSILTVATKFLKDNDITVDAGASQELQEMEARLAERKIKPKASVTDITDFFAVGE